MAYEINTALMLQQMLEVCAVRRHACLIPTRAWIAEYGRTHRDFIDYSTNADSCHEIPFRFHKIVISDSFEGSQQKQKSRLDKSCEHGGPITGPPPPIHRCRSDLFKCLRTALSKLLLSHVAPHIC
ncbi:hypothetical protein CEXT_414721 [Caerostris extrusa]|uniref:Uncharacterized protein n=1 Tax=Caerostris extrusa TaxID=172846 RepID=A0AAV4RAH6_CAEEX|nr:hypothetical protein CEXT_414721 [Caerostris extrusa]